MKLVALVVRIVGGLAAIVVVVVIALLVRGHGIITNLDHRRVPAVRVAPAPELLARGQHLASISCAACHSAQGALPLSGGHENFLDIPNGPKFGVLHASNLTAGGVLPRYTDGALLRAIREGVRFDGRPLLVMPSENFHSLSDRDVAALITYVRSQPSDPYTPPERRFAPTAYLVLGLQMFPSSVQRPIDRIVPEVPEAADTTYGAYLATFLDCRSCHGADYHGGRKGQFPPIGPNLVTVARAQPLAIFERAVRQGIGVDGRGLRPEQMPWRTFSQLSDLEVASLYAFLSTRP